MEGDVFVSNVFMTNFNKYIIITLFLYGSCKTPHAEKIIEEIYYHE